jgi:biotin carboxyl carrier protein
MTQYKLRIGDTEYAAEVREMTSDYARVVVDETEYTVNLISFGSTRPPAAEIKRPAGTSSPPTPSAPQQTRPGTAGTSGSLRSPLPGLIIELKVRQGEAVQAGQPVVIMEAMKMENVIPAPHNGTVKKIFVAAGDSVGEGEVLVEIGRPEMTTL